MRFIIFLFTASLLVSHSTHSQRSIKSILVLGDSYLKGHFGAFLQKEIHECGKYDVLSIAIGGAGSKTFLPPMKNKCCGYRVRQTCAGDTLVKTKKITEVKIPILERAEKPTSGLVMSQYGGNLLSIMNIYKPDAVILVLGTNRINAHKELLDIIKSHDNYMPIIWVGPFNKNNSVSRYTLIKSALKNQSGCFLVKSDSIVNKLGLKPTHFYGTEAKKLAKAVYKQFEPFLNTSLISEYEKILNSLLFQQPDIIKP